MNRRWFVDRWTPQGPELTFGILTQDLQQLALNDPLLTVQKELMRHASIQTTMNIYGKAMTDSKRQAHRKVVEMVLKTSKERENAPLASRQRLLGVNGSLREAQKSVHQLILLVAGRGFEPPTFGL